jgi:asparagine synthase (glutamine-hydrolysing)
MHFGIETRVPFLDHRLVEWALAQPAGALVRQGWTKYPVRDYLHRRGLKAIAWRSDKLGFVAPQLRWIRELQAPLAESIAGMEVPAVLNRDAILQLATNPSPRPDHLTEFWRIYALLRWINHFGVSIA